MMLLLNYTFTTPTFETWWFMMIFHEMSSAEPLDAGEYDYYYHYYLKCHKRKAGTDKEIERKNERSKTPSEILN